jgi:hypothetical protein
MAARANWKGVLKIGGLFYSEAPRVAIWCPTSKTSRVAFNAHSPGDGGSGLVQPVFRSPARIPAAESTRRGLEDKTNRAPRSPLF